MRLHCLGVLVGLRCIRICCFLKDLQHVEVLSCSVHRSNINLVVFVRYISCVIHNVRKHAMYIGKFVIKAAWRTFRLDSCVVSVLREYPVPSAVEHNKSVIGFATTTSGKKSSHNWINFY